MNKKNLIIIISIIVAIFSISAIIFFGIRLLNKTKNIEDQTTDDQTAGTLETAEILKYVWYEDENVKFMYPEEWDVRFTNWDDGVNWTLEIGSERVTESSLQVEPKENKFSIFLSTEGGYGSEATYTYDPSKPNSLIMEFIDESEIISRTLALTNPKFRKINSTDQYFLYSSNVQFNEDHKADMFLSLEEQNGKYIGHFANGEIWNNFSQDNNLNGEITCQIKTDSDADICAEFLDKFFETIEEKPTVANLHFVWYEDEDVKFMYPEEWKVYKNNAEQDYSIIISSNQYTDYWDASNNIDKTQFLISMLSAGGFGSEITFRYYPTNPDILEKYDLDGDLSGPPDEVFNITDARISPLKGTNQHIFTATVDSDGKMEDWSLLMYKSEDSNYYSGFSSSLDIKEKYSGLTMLGCTVNNDNDFNICTEFANKFIETIEEKAVNLNYVWYEDENIKFQYPDETTVKITNFENISEENPIYLSISGENFSMELIPINSIEDSSSYHWTEENKLIIEEGFGSPRSVDGKNWYDADLRYLDRDPYIEAIQIPDKYLLEYHPYTHLFVVTNSQSLMYGEGDVTFLAWLDKSSETLRYIGESKPIISNTIDTRNEKDKYFVLDIQCSNVTSKDDVKTCVKNVVTFFKSLESKN